ncbi:MAG: DUF5677 domain-containing protein [Deltaproteobacteria bacterium]|nr:DUF5677 domain-containing protein [Deltaproteobacteria bacterium]
MANTNHLDFRHLFFEANSIFNRSAGLNDLKASFSDVLITSAIAKCLDYNRSSQSVNSDTPSFFLVANARAMCEELIYCSVFRYVGDQSADDLAKKLNNLSTLDNVHTQTRFFALNNRLQPTLGGFKESTAQKAAIKRASSAVLDVWKRLGLSSTGDRRPPTIRQLSHRVGLCTTYDYVYSLTSKFVHFSPAQLFRLGWGPMDGPFSFCVDSFEGYFSSLARFLGVLIFLGYCHLATEKFGLCIANRYADTIAKQLQSGFRWPEITTFEEMNQTAPDSIITRLLMTIVREDTPNAMPDVLTELEGLAKLR